MNPSRVLTSLVVLLQLTASGQNNTLVASANTPGELNWLHAIALDSKGNVYLGDIIAKRVQKFILLHSSPGVGTPDAKRSVAGSG